MFEDTDYISRLVAEMIESATITTTCPAASDKPLTLADLEEAYDKLMQIPVRVDSPFPYLDMGIDFCSVDMAETDSTTDTFIYEPLFTVASYPTIDLSSLYTMSFDLLARSQDKSQDEEDDGMITNPITGERKWL